MNNVNYIVTPVVTGEEIRLIETQLDRILTSKYFKSAKQMQRFLKYIVERAVKDEGLGIKQYTIGVEALSFKKDFDPDQNPAVRIIASRVRERLNDYYSHDRDSDEIIITMHKGSYIPEFKKNTHLTQIPIIKRSNISRGPRLALVSFDDKTQSQKANSLLLQVTDSLATEISRFLYLQLHVNNPYSDKSLSHLSPSEIKTTDRADYILSLYSQKVTTDENKYKLIYRLVLVDTGETIWSENHLITEQFDLEKENVIGKITTTVADPLLGMMHTHWSRELLTDLDTVPDEHKVLVYFRNYTDCLNKSSFSRGVEACLDAFERNTNDVIAKVIYAEYCRHEYIFNFGIIDSPLEAGLSYIESAIQLRRNSHEARYMHGIILFCLQDTKASLEEFKLARSLSKNNIIIEFGIGFHYCKMDHWNKGLAIVNKAMSLSPTYPSIYHLIPFFDFYRQEKYALALAEAKKIIITDLVYAPLARCVSYAQLGKQKQAKEELEEVIKRYPKFMDTGRDHMSRFLGVESLTEKIWDGVLKANA